MSTLTELEQADRVVKDTEMKLHKIKATIKDVEEEIAKLIVVEAQLEENLSVLKKQGTLIVSASGFKKATEDLVRTKGRLAVLKIDQERFHKAKDDCETYFQNAKDKYKAIFKGGSVLKFRNKKDGG